MRKYTALGHYLSNLDSETKSVTLSFSEIAEIIEDILPDSAYQHMEFWGNDTQGTHTWALTWRDAGWEKSHVSLEKQNVTFIRTKMSIDQILDSLHPRNKENIYDLVAQTGISMNPWHLTNNGIQLKNAKSNPNYCFNWSFGSQNEKYALCIWYNSLQIKNNQIIFRENLRALYSELKLLSRSSSDRETKSRALKQSLRAKEFDDAIKDSYARGIPMSIIINEGDQQDRAELGEKSSKVKRRSLDFAKWYVHEYSDTTGESLIVRGVKSHGVTDEIDKAIEEDVGPPDIIQIRAIKARRGQRKFREKLLAAYGRRCAVTNCEVVELLEAAHIEPHAQLANYRVTNGLLLRADIHTLFDLNLLYIDDWYKVILAPSLLESEYKIYHNKVIRQPERPSEMPNKDALSKRRIDFQKNS